MYVGGRGARPVAKPVAGATAVPVLEAWYDAPRSSKHDMTTPFVAGPTEIS